MIVRDRLYLDGAWTAPLASSVIDVLDPNIGEVLGAIPAATADDVDRAVMAARRAFSSWSRTGVDERSDLLRQIAAGIEKHRDELLDLVIREVGTPRHQAVQTQVGIAVHSFRDAADNAARAMEPERIGHSRVVREALGVAAAITPWNFPLYQIALKVAPALAAGCTVVLKPSEIAGLSPFVLADIIDAVGLPPGVFNLVSGTGPEAGEALVRHPEVDIVSFTGSDRAGRRVAELAGARACKVTLELGGKSALLVLEDADVPAAVRTGVSSCFANGGQVCAALSRMIVHRSRLEEVERLAAEVAAEYRAGDPSAVGTTLAPVVSAAQRDRARDLIATGERDGARLIYQGNLPDGPGFRVPPTVFSEVAPDSTIAQEEVFAPVLAIIGVEDDDEAVRVANGTRYGLNAAVWSADVGRAERVGSRLDASTVYINGAAFNPSAPFGGTKQSGFGRERGLHGITEYLRLKSFQY